MFPDFLLTNALAQLAATKEARTVPFSRTSLFAATALQLCEYFIANPKLESFQFTTVLKVDELHGGGEVTIQQRHHIKVVTTGCPDLLDADGKTRFFYEAMPFWTLGTGTFTVTRSTPALVELLRAETGSDDKRIKAYGLALELEAAFPTVSHECYIGEVL